MTKEIKMKIVVGYNGSDESKRALKVAIKHAKDSDGTIYVITSLMPSGKHTKDTIEAKKNLENAITFIKDLGIRCEEHLFIDKMGPGEDLVQFAENNNADEIIIGIEKKSKVDKFLLGSTAQYVILHSPCMVISVK
jgi:nucleotide-binding universal stress UspA family protein